MLKKRRVPPNFLKGKPISNERLSRHDAFKLARQSDALNTEFQNTDEDWEVIVNAQKWLKESFTLNKY